MSGACNGICLTGYDIGLPSGAVAYPHPTCPAHGYLPDHPYEHDFTDGYGHEICKCGGVRETHEDEPDCPHVTWSNGSCFDCGVRP